MAGDDYSFAGGGLKLKGSAGIVKKKKNKSKDKEKSNDVGEKREQALLDAVSENEQSVGKGRDFKVSAPQTTSEDLDAEDLQTLPSLDGKTDAERRHEEMRRRRLLDRFKKEGIKTHKERVEELNKYLSNLSEHHDMPRIGPG